MNIWIYILFLLASLGALNGLIAGLILIIKKTSPPNMRYLGGLLIVLSIRIGKSVYYYFDHGVDRLILQIGLSACLFIGPLFFLFLKATIQKERTYLRNDLLTLSILLLAIITVGVLYPYRQFPEFWNQYFVKTIYAIWAIGVISGVYISRRRIFDAFKFSKLASFGKDQVLIIVLAVVFITTTYQFAFYISGFTYIWGAFAFTIFFYYMMINIVFKNLDFAQKASSAKPIDNAQGLKSQVDQLMLKGELYLNPKLKLDDLAQAVKLDRNTLSRLLNEEYPFGFSNYVNEFRVEKAKELILSRQDLSLEGIGYEAGFNSKSSFFSAFKKIALCTPSQFKKSLAS
jgi:AraC-like DNA-binding protein